MPGWARLRMPAHAHTPHTKEATVMWRCLAVRPAWQARPCLQGRQRCMPAPDGFSLACVDGATRMAADGQHPELMLRTPDTLPLRGATVVCGCGGGEQVAAWIPQVLAAPGPVVLDADALNALARDSALQALLRARGRRGQITVLTPHPLEAARLLGKTTAQVQADRLTAARQLARDSGAIIVLKGSGSIVAAPGMPPTINPTGNARLATAGTGDVLAGLVGAWLHDTTHAAEAAARTSAAVYAHGALADQWPAGTALTAGRLAAALHI